MSATRTTVTKNHFGRREGNAHEQLYQCDDPPSPFDTNNYTEADNALVALLRNSDDRIYGTLRTEKPRQEIVEQTTVIGFPTIDNCFDRCFHKALSNNVRQDKLSSILVSEDTSLIAVIKYFGTLFIDTFTNFCGAAKRFVGFDVHTSADENGKTSTLVNVEEGLYAHPKPDNAQIISRMVERIRREVSITPGSAARKHLHDDNSTDASRPLNDLKDESFWSGLVQNEAPSMHNRKGNPIIEITIDIEELRINKHPLFTEEERFAQQITVEYEWYRKRVEANTLHDLLKRLTSYCQHVAENSSGPSQDNIVELVSTADKVLDEVNCIIEIQDRIEKLWKELLHARDRAGFVCTSVVIKTSEAATESDFENVVSSLIETMSLVCPIIYKQTEQALPATQRTLEVLQYKLTSNMEQFKRTFTLEKSDSNGDVPKEEKIRRRKVSSESYFARLVINGYPVGDTRRVKIDWPSYSIKLPHRFHCKLQEHPNACCLELYMAPTGFLPSHLLCSVFICLPRVTFARGSQERISSVPTSDWYEFSSLGEFKGTVLVSTTIEINPSIHISSVKVPPTTTQSQVLRAKKAVPRDLSHTRESMSGNSSTQIRQLMLAFKCNNTSLISDAFIEPARHTLLKKRQINPSVPSPIPVSTIELMNSTDAVYGPFLRQDSEDIREELIDDALRERSAVQSVRAAKVLKDMLYNNLLRGYSIKNTKQYAEVVQDASLFRFVDRGEFEMPIIPRKRSFAPSSLSLLRTPPKNSSDYSLLLSVVLGKNLPIRSSDSNASKKPNDLEEINLGFIVKIQLREKSYFTRATHSTTPFWNENVLIPLDFIDDQDNLTLMLEKESVNISVFDCVDIDMRLQGGFYDDEDTKLLSYFFMGSATIPLITVLRNGHIDGFIRCSSPDHIVGYSRQEGEATAAELMLRIYATTDPIITAPPKFNIKYHSNESSAVMSRVDQWSEMFLRDTYCSILWSNIHGVAHLANRFIAEQNPPRMKHRTLEACAHYVSLIPCRKDWKSLLKLRTDQDSVLTSQQTLDILAGNNTEHAVMLANFFLYLSKENSSEYGAEVFLVLGFSIPEGSTVWVMRKCRGSGKVTLWDAILGCAYACEDDSIPLQKIFCLVSNNTIYANLRRETKPHSLDFDVNNIRRWAQLHVPALDDSPSQHHSLNEEEALYYSPPNNVFARELQDEIKESIKSAMREWRRTHTSFRTDIVPNLVSVLERKEQSKLSGEERDAIAIEVSTKMRNIFGFSLHFGYTDNATILAKIKSSEIHNNRNPNVEFSIAVRVFSYPGNVMSVWVYVCSITPT